MLNYWEEKIMAVIEELIRTEPDGGISFGNYKLDKKTKRTDFEVGADLYYVKTFKEITRLERNDTVLYESVPGTSVTGMKLEDGCLKFTVEGDHDVQITLGLSEDVEYRVVINGNPADRIRTSMGGKLAFSVNLAGTGKAEIEVTEVDD